MYCTYNNYKLIKKYSNKKFNKSSKIFDKLYMNHNNNKNFKWYCFKDKYINSYYNKIGGIYQKVI